MLFSELGLDNRIVQALENQKFTETTPIQRQAIPYAAHGRDILGCAKTGSGKTLAFVIPIIARLISQKAMTKRDPRAMILAPTRELAKQVFQVTRDMARALNLKTALIVGGDNYNDQAKVLRKDPHILVGTPGRIADHLSDRSFFLNGLEILVYDEADRMLDLGFNEQLLAIHRQADHRKRQTLLFSATLDDPKLRHLLDSLLNNPQEIMLDASYELHADITQTLFFADHVEHKQDLLKHELETRQYNQAIVFVATKADADRLSSWLQQTKMNCVALHGDLLQNQRANVINAFGNGQHDILVCTDLGARGLDLRKVNLVINFDLPKHVEEFVHRVGRTGRAGEKGTAISFVGPRDWQSYRALSKHITQELPVHAHPALPGEFKGKDIKKKLSTEQTKTFKKKPTSKAPKTHTKRVDNTSGTDIGHVPIKRKPRPEAED